MLPNEILFLIFEASDVETMMNLRRCCRSLMQYSTTNRKRYTLDLTLSSARFREVFSRQILTPWNYRLIRSFDRIVLSSSSISVDDIIKLVRMTMIKDMDITDTILVGKTMLGSSAPVSPTLYGTLGTSHITVRCRRSSLSPEWETAVGQLIHHFPDLTLTLASDTNEREIVRSGSDVSLNYLLLG
jgi:hypothetical protein